MLPTAHFFSGIAIYCMFVIFDLIPNNFFFFALIVICSMIPDVDNLFSSLHRNLFTHTPLFWGFITIIILIISPSSWLVIFPFSVHLFLDTLDYGIMVLYPLSRKKYGLGILGKGTGIASKSDITYFRGYVKNKKMLFLEFLLLVTSFILIILILRV